MRWRLRERGLALLLGVSVAACGWKVTPPLRAERPVSIKHIAERVVLSVNDRGVSWGGGEMGGTLRDVLIATGAFREVYYPIEPRNPPPLRLTVNASGTVDEEVALGILKSVVIGLLLFAPVGLIRFTKDFDLTADVRLSDQGLELAHFQVTSATRVSHTMFSTIEQYEAAGRRAAFTDLGQQIALQLSELPSHTIPAPE